MELLKGFWEMVMVLATIAYTAVVMYEYNRDLPPESRWMLNPADQKFSSFNGGLLNVTEDFVTTTPTPAKPECSMDLGDWLGETQILINFTFVVAIIFILDQVKEILEACCRRGMLGYLECPHNLFEFVITVVQFCSAVGVEVPNAVGTVSRRISKQFARCKKGEEIRDDVDEELLLDSDDMTSCLDKLWETFIAILTLAELAQSIAMEFRVDCASGPTLASKTPMPKVDFMNWESEERILFNVSCILSVIFILNLVYEWCLAGFTGFFRDTSRLHLLIIVIQTEGLQFGYPIPTCLGRIIRPISFLFGIGMKAKKVYDQLEDDYELQTKIVSTVEGAEEAAGSLTWCVRCCARRSPAPSGSNAPAPVSHRK